LSAFGVKRTYMLARLGSFYGLGIRRIGRIDEDSHAGSFRYQLMQELQLLCRQFGLKKLTPVRLAPGRARLATRPSRTGSSATMNMSGAVAVAAFAAKMAAVLPPASITATCRRMSSAISFRHAIELIFRPAVDDRGVVAFHIAGFCEALAESAQTIPQRLGRARVETPDHRHRRLLRARRERPRDRCHAAERG
jgi:hypothetical protein